MISFDLNGFVPITHGKLDVNSTYTRSPFDNVDELYVSPPEGTGFPAVPGAEPAGTSGLQTRAGALQGLHDRRGAHADQPGV
mgnify:CR=1 FL=1